MKNIKILALALLTVSFFVSSCTPDDKPEPVDVTTTGDLTITVDHLFGTEPLAFNADINLPSMETVRFTRYAYLLSDFTLTAADGSTVNLADQYALIEAHKGANSFTLTSVPSGTYTRVSFSVGLDSTVNHGNPNQYSVDHPLSPTNNSLHWNWQGGYIFTAIEGKTTMDNESFIFHLAGVQNKLDFSLPFSLTKTGETQEATLTYDVKEVFQGPEIYNISNDGASSHSTTSPVTVKLINNMGDVFSSIEMN